MTYVIEWDNAAVNFAVDGQQVRTVALTRPLKPLKLSMSVWTTVGGWPGLKKWGGETNWEANPEPISAEFNIISLPDMA